MNEEDVFDAILGDDETFLPDGWDGTTDLFTDKGELNDAAFTPDGEQADAETPEENDDGDAEASEVPTTDEEATDASDQSADDEPTETPADGQEVPESKPSRKLKLKVNHAEEELDIDAMSDDDLIALLQKGRAFDAMKDAENRRKYREVHERMVDAGMPDEVARIAAREAAGGSEYSLTDDEEETPAQAEQPAAETAVTRREAARDFAAEVAQLRALYPDFKETPDEVALAVSKGVPLLSAYLAYREKQSSKTAAALQRENAVLKQNAASAAKAPVKGVTGGGKATPEKKDPFEEGFDSALDW